jgi:hypothetical protein
MTENILAVNIRVSPFAMLDILDVEIRASLNEHASARVRGTISEELENAYLSMAQTDLPVSITEVDEGTEPCILFTGLIAQMEIYIVNGVKVLDLLLTSGTRLMDLAEHTRTYQDPALTYRDLLSSLGYYPEYSFAMRAGEGTAIGDLITQYKETDWVFVKRLASHFNACVIPDYISSGVGYYFGVPDKSSGVSIEPAYYRVIKGVGEFARKTYNQVDGLSESDETCYLVRDRAVYRMGQRLRFKGMDLRVFEVHSVLEGQVLQNYYLLKTEAGFKTPKVCNFKLVGASLAGSVISVKRDIVQMRLYEDNDDYGTGAKWFPYSTVYSSPDGTGWYAMPEIGDELRLYFPSEHESEAYTISAVNVDSPGMGTDVPSPDPGILSFIPPRTHPDVKTMINRFLKEVSLYPDKLVMTNNKDMMIVINDDEGIIIQSAKKISFKSDEAISIASSQSDLNILGSERVSLKVGGTKVILDKDVAFEGGSLYMQ